MGEIKNDIEKYIRGELSPAEMHALEKKALNDPFLADALAGAELINSQSYAADVTQLEKSLHDRIHTKDKVISMWTWTTRIAAALLLLAVTGYIIYSLSDNKATKQLALNKQEQPAASTEQIKEIPSVDLSVKDQQRSSSNNVSKEQPAPTTPMVTELEDEILSEPEKNAGEAEVPIPEVLMEEQASSIENEAGEAEKEKKLQYAPEPVAAHEPDGKRNKKGESIADNSPAIASTQKASKVIKDEDAANAQLTSDTSAVSVVIGYDKLNRKSSKDDKYKYQPATPVYGIESYKIYLSTNKRYPQQALVNKIEGTVIIQFTVTATGDLNNFEVLKGIDYGCNEEVIRLIKEGPKWMPAKRNDTLSAENVKVKLKFSLPD